MRQWLHEVQSWTPSESASLKTFCARCPSAVRRNEPGSCNKLRTNDPEPAAHLSLRIDASSSDADLLPALPSRSRSDCRTASRPAAGWEEAASEPCTKRTAVNAAIPSK